MVSHASALKVRQIAELLNAVTGAVVDIAFGWLFFPRLRVLQDRLKFNLDQFLVDLT